MAATSHERRPRVQLSRTAGNRPGRGGLLPWLALGLLGPALAALAIWLPLWRVYHVPALTFSPALLEASRSRPGAKTLAVLDQVRWTEAGPQDRETRLRHAEQALAGRLELPGQAPVVFSSPTEDKLLRHADGRVQLLAASMQVADNLLQAYRLTGERRYFERALAVTLAWADFDARLRFPLGLVWNDHALAARMIYLARFWAVYRHDALYDVAQAQRIFALVYRTAERLARPSLYAARTNHGIMQNLALLHAGIAFPALPGTSARTQVALDRLERHFAYYLNPDGLVLEHSASYQELGVELLRSLEIYLQLLNRSKPRWAMLAQRSRCLLARLSRPDGSLPLYGDSHGRLAIPGMRDYLAATPADRCQHAGTRIDTEFGYLLSTDPRASRQLFVAWTNFPGGAHKHADELSAYLWYRGSDWWGASGYWPYSDPQRGAAIGWRGTNAPHIRGETPDSQRASRLLSAGTDDRHLAIDLLRTTPAGQLRRQLLQLGPDLWLALDSTTRLVRGQQAEVLWSLAPGLQARSLGKDRWLVNAAGQAPFLELAFAGAASGAQAVRGDREPFAGMTALPDGSFSRNWYWPVVVPSNAWALSAWVGAAGPSGRLRAPPQVDWQSAEQWSISLALREGPRRVVRRGQRLELHGFASRPETLLLEAPPAARGTFATAVGAYQRILAEYPYFRDLLRYRWRASAGVALLGALQLALLILWYRMGIERPLRLILASGFGWCLLSAWLLFGYLR